MPTVLASSPNHAAAECCSKMIFKSNPTAAEFSSKSGHCYRKHYDIQKLAVTETDVQLFGCCSCPWSVGSRCFLFSFNTCSRLLSRALRARPFLFTFFVLPVFPRLSFSVCVVSPVFVGSSLASVGLMNEVYINKIALSK